MTEPQIRLLTVLYDDQCALCRTARRWLARRRQLVRLDFLPAGSPQARARFPGLDHAQTEREITVVADTGAVYDGDAAWLMCLWALSGYRATAISLARPGLRPLARQIVAAAAGVRRKTRAGGYGRACDDGCDAWPFDA